MSKFWKTIKAGYFWYEAKIVGNPHIVAVLWPVTLVLVAWWL